MYDGVAVGVNMIIVMDMSSGKRQEDEEFGAYSDEVLCSNWTPQPQLALGLQEANPDMPRQPARREPPEDLDEFLRILYLSQE
jgi:hypothetical protein